MIHQRPSPSGPLTPSLSRRERECRAEGVAAFRLMGLYAPLRRSPDKPQALPGVWALDAPFAGGQALGRNDRINQNLYKKWFPCRLG